MPERLVDVEKRGRRRETWLPASTYFSCHDQCSPNRRGAATCHQCGPACALLLLMSVSPVVLLKDRANKLIALGPVVAMHPLFRNVSPKPAVVLVELEGSPAQIP
jgi:hypothetical protein